MTNSTLIDIHTHQHLNNTKNFALFSQIHANFIHAPYYSIGLHPWSVEKIDLEDWKKHFLPYLAKSLAIGEVGLDKIKVINFELQKSVFLYFLELAIEHKKPIIIHLVKAYEEMLTIFKHYQPTIPIIFHAYHAPTEFTKAMMNYQSYFSFGWRELNRKNCCLIADKKMITKKFFLETDDGQQSIEECYLRASQMLGLTIDNIIEITQINFQEIFKNLMLP